jgi:hypothetical protein
LKENAKNTISGSNKLGGTQEVKNRFLQITQLKTKLAAR